MRPINDFGNVYLFEGSGSFSTKSLNISGMDDLFLKWVLFEWLRDR